MINPNDDEATPIPQFVEERAPVAADISAASVIDEAEVGLNFEVCPEPPVPDTLIETDAPIPESVPSGMVFDHIAAAGGLASPLNNTDSLIPICPVAATLDTIPDAPVPTIPPAPLRSIFERGNQ